MSASNTITLDGPSAAGKTTIAIMIADELGYTHLDSGAVFRSITLSCLNNGIDLTNPTEVIHHLPEIKLRVSDEKYFLKGENITEAIRTPLVSQNVFRISHVPEVRHFMEKFQHSCAKSKKVVCDGRKVGTELFPYARFKFFLTAAPEVRAMRRYQQFLNKGIHTSFSEVFKDLKARDESDIRNGILTIPDGAVVIDSSYQTPEETFMQLESYLKK